MEGRIISEINRLIRDCEECGYKDQGSKIVRFTFTQEYDPKEVYDYIHYKMMEVIHKLEKVSADYLFEFGYEVSRDGDVWDIGLEWTSKTLNPFENVSVD